MELIYDDKTNRRRVRRLWQEAFQDSEAFADYYFEQVYPKNQVLFAREDEVIRSMLHLNPYRWVWRLSAGFGALSEQKEVSLCLHYIVGVATEKESRRQGLMRACLSRALQDMADWQEPFTYLMPARKEYYEPFQFVPFKEERRWRRWERGWRLCQAEEGREKQPDGIPGQSEDVPEQPGKWGYTLYPARSEEYRSRLAAEVECEKGGILTWGSGGEYCAYGIEARNEGPVIVIEQLFLEKGEDILFLLEHKLLPLLYQRCGKLPVEYVESQSMMLRILNLPDFVKLLPYKGEPRQFTLRIMDEICTGNQGVFHFLLDSAGCRTTPVDASPMPAGEPETWNMAELTRYLLKESRLAEQVYLVETV